MRKLFILLALAAMCALPLMGQDKVEVFGGYQYTRVSPGGGFDGINSNGWNASVTGNVNHWLGVTADMSAGYNSLAGTNANMYNFLFGPTVSYRKSEHFTPFAHALFGVSHADAGLELIGTDTANSFAMALGGGVDAGVTRHLAIRLVQADWLRTDFASTSQNNARISSGIVFRF